MVSIWFMDIVYLFYVGDCKFCLVRVQIQAVSC